MQRLCAKQHENKPWETTECGNFAGNAPSDGDMLRRNPDGCMEPNYGARRPCIQNFIPIRRAGSRATARKFCSFASLDQITSGNLYPFGHPTVESAEKTDRETRKPPITFRTLQLLQLSSHHARFFASWKKRSPRRLLHHFQFAPSFSTALTFVPPVRSSAAFRCQC